MFILTKYKIVYGWQVTSVYYEEGWLDTKIYMLSSLAAGHCIPGPAIIMDKLSTILIEPGLSNYVSVSATETFEY